MSDGVRKGFWQDYWFLVIGSQVILVMSLLLAWLMLRVESLIVGWFR